MTDNATMTISELAKAIITLASEKKVMLVLAESCTGGMIAAALTDIAGSSAVLDRGLVIYSNQAKQEIGRASVMISWPAMARFRPRWPLP